MTPKLSEPCKTCGGTGKVPRSVRRLPNGELDQFDTLDWPETICDACTGSGVVDISPETVQETA
jgi:DnaJ-class molecular chaperone